MTFTIFDTILILVASISMLLGFFRGFIKDFFSLTNWILATVIAYLISPLILKLLKSYIGNSIFVQAAIGIAIFIAIFIIIAIFTAKIVKSLDKKVPEVVDKSCGVLFGLVKTLFIFGLIYSVTYNIYAFFSFNNFSLNYSIKNKKIDLPDWLDHAASYKIVKFCGEIVDPLAKRIVSDTVSTLDPKALNNKTEKKINKKIDKAIDKGQKVLDSTQEKLEDLNIDDQGGYSKKEIEKMNRLIEIVQ